MVTKVPGVIPGINETEKSLEKQVILPKMDCNNCMYYEDNKNSIKNNKNVHIFLNNEKKTNKWVLLLIFLATPHSSVIYEKIQFPQFQAEQWDVLWTG